MKRFCLYICFSFLTATVLCGQENIQRDTTTLKADSGISRFAISTNVVDWGWFLSPNLEIQYAVGRHVSLDASAIYNGWTYNNSDMQKRNRQCRQEYSLGMRWWPWYVYSGWWVGAGAQYQEYSRRPMDNVFHKEEGDAYGITLSGGYSIHVNPWFNVDIGLGFWAGSKSYKVYESVDKACPECGKRIDRTDGSEAPSKGFFFSPEQVLISLMFIF